MSSPERRYYTVTEIAAELKLAKVDGVYKLIRSGALAAVNISPAGTRPLWRVTRAALDAFLAARSSVPPAPATPRRRPRREKVTAYF